MPTAIENLHEKDTELESADYALNDLTEQIKRVASMLDKDAAGFLKTTVSYPTLEVIKAAVERLEKAKAAREAAYDEFKSPRSDH